MNLYEINKFYQRIVNKGINYGLTMEDYKKIKKVMNNMDQTIISEDETSYNLYMKLNELIQEFYNKGLLHRYPKELTEYIYRKTFLLPLVLANNEDNKIKMTSFNSYLFLCQFHQEKTPSLKITDWNNNGYCYGCGITLDNISYLSQYEGITNKQALELLLDIYLIDIKNKKTNSEINSVTKKYRQIILSDKYKELLLMGKERLIKIDKTEIGCMNIEEFYKQRFDMIERIKQNEYDQTFTYQETEKILYLNKSFYKK